MPPPSIHHGLNKRRVPPQAAKSLECEGLAAEVKRQEVVVGTMIRFIRAGFARANEAASLASATREKAFKEAAGAAQDHLIIRDLEARGVLNREEANSRLHAQVRYPRDSSTPLPSTLMPKPQSRLGRWKSRWPRTSRRRLCAPGSATAIRQPSRSVRPTGVQYWMHALSISTSTPPRTLVPCTLNPAPHTLHPQLRTFNPQPQTPNPKP